MGTRGFAQNSITWRASLGCPVNRRTRAHIMASRVYNWGILLVTNWPVLSAGI